MFFLVFQAKGVGCIGEGGDSKWDIDDDDMEEEVKAESAVKSKIPEQSTGRCYFYFYHILRLCQY